MRIILLGAPGCGKGTQAQRLTDRFHIPKLTTGDMLRSAVRAGSALGREAEQFMNSGALVPDAVMIGLIRERLTEKDCAAGFLLDGFPRTVAQAEALDVTCRAVRQTIDNVLEFEVPESEILQRLTGRLVCDKCGAGYHAVTQPPQIAGKCDRCDGNVVRRADDSDTTVRKRLNVYREATEPMIAYYAGLGVVRKVNAVGTVDEVFERLCSLIDRN